jgi:hypothetical protein
MDGQRGTALKRARSRLALCVAIAIAVILASGETVHEASHASAFQRATVDFFPIGWYNALDKPASLFSISRVWNAVMPYHVPTADPAAYLDTAERAGVKVMLEIDRTLVRSAEPSEVAAFASRYKDHPALFAWYLADEPSTTVSLGPLSPERARALYDAIKSVDPVHPVAIAFSTGEDPRQYAPAMDVLMYDNYPFLPATPELGSLGAWWWRVKSRAAIARDVGGFIPILQAFGGPGSPVGFARRLPTAKEERYMVFASIEAGATGIFFWTWYRADPVWVRDTLAPVVAELRPLDAALRAGPVETLTTADTDDVGVTVLKDPGTGEHVLLVIHHGFGKVTPRIALDPALRRATATERGRRVEISHGVLETTLRSFGVRVYRFASPSR